MQASTRIRHRLFMAVCLLLAGISPSQAQSLPEVLQAALKKHPRIQEAAAAIRTAEADVAVAETAFNPRVSIDGSTGLEAQAGSSGKLLAASPTVRWSRLLNDGGRAGRDVDLRGTRVQQARAAARVIEEDLGLQIAVAYVGLAQSKDGLRLARNWVAALQEVESMAREIQLVDRGRQTDFVHATSRVSTARAQMIARQSSVAQAARHLDELVGGHVFVDTPLDLSLASRSGAGPSDHPRVQVALAAARSAEAQLALDSLYDKPRLEIDAFIGAGRDADRHMRLFNHAGVRIVGSLNILDGGFGKATAHVSRQRLEQARTAVEGVERDVRISMARDLIADETANDRISAFAATIGDVAKVRSMMIEQFKAGRRPLLDLLSQESEIFQTSVSHSQEQHEAIATRIRLAHGRGELLPAFGVPSALKTGN